jgi:hypothetical protein
MTSMQGFVDGSYDFKALITPISMNLSLNLDPYCPLYVISRTTGAEGFAKILRHLPMFWDSNFSGTVFVPLHFNYVINKTLDIRRFVRSNVCQLPYSPKFLTEAKLTYLPTLLAATSILVESDIENQELRLNQCSKVVSYTEAKNFFIYYYINEKNLETNKIHNNE